MSVLERTETISCREAGSAFAAFSGRYVTQAWEESSFKSSGESENIVKAKGAERAGEWNRALEFYVKELHRYEQDSSAFSASYQSSSSENQAMINCHAQMARCYEQLGEWSNADKHSALGFELRLQIFAQPRRMS